MTKKRNTRQRELGALRAEAREYLAKRGHKAGHIHSMAGYASALEQELGHSGDIDVLTREYIDKIRESVCRRHLGLLVDRPLTLSSRWIANTQRAERDQPKLWTPDGIGNGEEFNYRGNYGKDEVDYGN
jgi:hypothetical protein